MALDQTTYEPFGVKGEPALVQLARRTGFDGWAVLALPFVLMFVALFVYPLVFMGAKSLPSGEWTAYLRIARSSVYLNVIWSTFKVSALVTLVCLVLGYPYAYALSCSRSMTKAFLTIALFLPFWISILLRTFSWLVLLQDTGLVNSMLLGAGIIEKPIALVRNLFGVTIGMMHILLPYMILPILSVMRSVNPRLLDASKVCGASPLRTFLRVYLPLTMPGVLAGSVLTLTLSLGFYITPALLGGGRNTMIAQLIADQVNQQANFAFASALAVILIIFTAIAFALLGILLRVSRAKIGAVT